jgi:uncharacterized protein YxjI
MNLIIHQINQKLFDNHDMTSDESSDSININNYSLYAVQYIFDSFAGIGFDVNLEVSNDGENFSVLDTFTSTDASGSFMVNVEKAGYSFVRVSLEGDTVTAGNLTVIFNGKML